VIVILLAVLVVTGWIEHWPPAVFGPSNPAAQAASKSVTRDAPVSAVKVVVNLASRDTAIVRNSLAVSYSMQVSTAVLAPAGTRIRVLPGTWQQYGADASLRAVVSVPGRAPVTELIYLVREEGRWRVLFTDAP
jgi:hypothetical protein